MWLALPGRQLTEGTWRSAAHLSFLFACLCLLFPHLVLSARLPISLSLPALAPVWDATQAVSLCQHSASRILAVLSAWLRAPAFLPLFSEKPCG